MWLPRWLCSKEFSCQCRRLRRSSFDPWVRKIPWRSAWQPTPIFLPGECWGQKSLVGYGPQGHKELNMTEATRCILTRYTICSFDMYRHREMITVVIWDIDFFQESLFSSKQGLPVSCKKRTWHKLSFIYIKYARSIYVHMYLYTYKMHTQLIVNISCFLVHIYQNDKTSC